ncbi:hypothetical protein ACFQPF_18055 [Fictibacillus iocasae]|uniref:Spore coat protein n=1 Tax=Fictibacillus iocasae TaxID=2715437 RepID=A0ABW2NUM8_9BACL
MSCSKIARHLPAKCENCGCAEDICTRNLRSYLVCLTGRRITIIVASRTAPFFVGRLVKVDCGTVVIQNEGQLPGPILIKICDILAIGLGDFFAQTATANQDSCFLETQKKTCRTCDCPCSESICVKDLREQLQSCVQRQVTIFFSSLNFQGLLKRVECGVIVLNVTSIPFGPPIIPIDFIIPICQISVAAPFLTQGTAAAALTGCAQYLVQNEEQTCHCECVEDSCTISLRKELTKCTGKRVTVFLKEAANLNGIIKKVNCGTLLFESTGGPVLIPLCVITAIAAQQPATPAAGALTSFISSQLSLAAFFPSTNE